MQRNFQTFFPQTSHYFVFQLYLYININTKKKHTTTTTTTCLYKQEKSKSFSRAFPVTYMQGRKKTPENYLKKLCAPSKHSKWTKPDNFPLFFFPFLLEVYLSGHLTLTLRELALRSFLPSVGLSQALPPPAVRFMLELQA